MALRIDNHFVAFIDILGFSEMVRSDCESPNGTKYLELLYKVHHEAAQTLGKDVEAGLIQFSDSIVFSRPFDLFKLNEFLVAVSKWQRSLLLSGLLCRGGITFGKHFVNDRFMFSKGLIDAYYLESAKAKFPRIIISKDLIELAKDSIKWESSPVIKEEDGSIFVDYLTHENAEMKGKLMAAAGKLCEQQVSNSSVQEKLRWLGHYADFKLGSNLSKPRFSP